VRGHAQGADDASKAVEDSGSLVICACGLHGIPCITGRPAGRVARGAFCRMSTLAPGQSALCVDTRAASAARALQASQ
jgi:hypothetical protein